MAFAEPKLGVLFPVPLLTFRLDEAETLNAELVREVAARRKAEPGIGRSNLQGWHSATDLFARTEPGHAALAEEIDAIVAAATAKMVPDLPAEMKRRHEGWINVSPTGAMNAPHDHTGAFWSGCYYVQVPDSPDPDDKTSGAIEFIDPRGSAGGMAIDAPFARSKYTVRPAAGMCLLWPAFVKHWVHPNRSTEDRITIAFNSWFSRK